MVKIKVIFSKDFEAHHSHPFFDVVATQSIRNLKIGFEMIDNENGHI